VGETAPLLLLTVIGDATNLNPFSGPISTLPTYIFQWVGVSSAIAIQRAWGGALVLLVLVGIIFVIARIFGKQNFKVKDK
jgi:phosphate transport system permease protein